MISSVRTLRPGLAVLGAMLLALALGGCGSPAGAITAAGRPAATAGAPSATPPPTPRPGGGAETTMTTKPKPGGATTKPPATGIGVWLLAPGGTGVMGTGGKGLKRYRVEVEQATGLSAASVASTVDLTLGGARGWTNEGWTFRRVTAPVAEVQMVVRVATPATVDRICWEQGGLRTGGVVSCRAGKYVMLNLTRWNTGVSAYAGQVALYRILVVNHEVGHLLGHGHKNCPGAGRPEPVMMQVYYTGLQGCTRNAWPYADDGTLIG